MSIQFCKFFYEQVVLVQYVRSGVFLKASVQGRACVCRAVGSFLVCLLAMLTEGHALGSISTYIFAWVKLGVAMDVGPFSLISGAEPRPPHVLFMLWRLAEMYLSGQFFYNHLAAVEPGVSKT